MAGLSIGETNIGGWNVYRLSSAPAEATAMAMSGGVPTGGVNLGVTANELQFKLGEETVLMDDTAQIDGIADAYKNKTLTEISFTFRQIHNFDEVERMILDAAKTTNGGQTFLEGGGKHVLASTKKFPIAFVRELAQDPGKYEYFVLYNCFFGGSKDFSWSRDNYTDIPFTVKPLTDTSRTAGKQIWRWGVED